MPRKPRAFAANDIYHVILRVNGWQDVFFTDHDQRRWVRLRGLRNTTKTLGLRTYH